MRSNDAPSGLIHQFAQMLCVLVVMNGVLLCIATRLSRHAPYAFLIKAFDLLNTALLPVLLAMVLAATAAAFLRPALGTWLAVATIAMIAWQLTAILADVAPRQPAMTAGTGTGTVTGGTAILRVLTINAFHENPDPDRLRGVIEAAAPDIVAIEEGDGTPGQAIMHTLPAFHRIVSCDHPPCSITILSRWPGVRVATPMPAEPELPDLLFARIALPPAMRANGSPAATIDVVAVHLPRGYRPVAAHFRALMLDVIQRWRSGPVILAGDFNLPSGAAALADIAHDAKLHRADRWIATYPADRPFPAFAAIDHLFVDRTFGVRECRRLPFAGSDHYGIVCDIMVPTVR